VDTTMMLRNLDDDEQRWRSVRDSLLGSRVRDTQDQDETGELDRVGQHPADLASDAAERELDFGVMEEAGRMLDEIGDARARVAAGTYGVCQTCGGRIPDERLAAVPATRYCVVHERALEPVWSTGAVGRTLEAGRVHRPRPRRRDDAGLVDATASARRMRS